MRDEPFPRPATDDRDAWRAYWTALGMPWRTEAEIPDDRQRFLAARRTITPDVAKSVFPFINVTLSRADLEWLLATHEDKGKTGPVDTDDLQAGTSAAWSGVVGSILPDPRLGLDVRGADLSGLDLSGLPLARTRGSLTRGEPPAFDLAARQTALNARMRLARAKLRGADLRQALLMGVELDEADLQGANLVEALLDDAHLQRSNLQGAVCQRAGLVDTHLDGASLAGADLTQARAAGAKGIGVSLAGAVLRDTSLATARLPQADLRGADLRGAGLFSAVLDGAQLEDAMLDDATIADASLDGASLARASLKGVIGRSRLQDSLSKPVSFRGANLVGADLSGADLPGARFEGADLTGASLARARLERASFKNARLTEADLSAARLEAADLRAAHLERADLRSAVFDAATLLEDVSFGTTLAERPLVAGLRWGDADLTGLDWDVVTAVGDERLARERRDASGKVKRRVARLAEREAAVRANRQLATALEEQGLSDEATPFAYRAQVLQRQVLWRQLVWCGDLRSLGPFLFSTLLAVLTGYGYRMWRLVAAYLLVVGASAAAYYLLAPRDAIHLAWPDAFLVSVTAIHGRVFSEQFQPGSLVGWITVVESIAGLVIEGTFVAMLTQRFFGK